MSVLLMRKGPCGAEHSKSQKAEGRRQKCSANTSAFCLLPSDFRHKPGSAPALHCAGPFSRFGLPVVVLSLEGETSVRRFAVILSLAVLAGSCRGSGKKDEQFKTEKADRGNITQTVTATGTLSAVTTVQIGSQVSGVISRLYADFNSRVHKGQLLAELDPTPFQQQVEQRQADVAKSRVEAANAKITYERQKRLNAAGLAAQADLDGAKAQYESALAQVRQSTAALSQAQTNLHYTTINSPIDGIVVDRAYDVGQTVAASF